MFTILTEKNSLPVFPCYLGHYYSYEESEKSIRKLLKRSFAEVRSDFGQS